MKKMIVGLLMLIPLQFVKGQDIIITIQHDSIHCRIISILPTHIQYEQAENGNIVGRFIPTEQVLSYLRSPQSAGRNPIERVERNKSQPARRWLIGLYPGGSSSLASYEKDRKKLLDEGISKSQVDNYLKQMRHGWNFSGDVHYLFSNGLGLGAEYSLFTISAKQDFTVRLNSWLPEFAHMEMKENIYIQFAGPSILFQQWLDTNHKFQISGTFSVGYVHYRSELRQDQGLLRFNALAEGNTWGLNTGLSFGYFPLPWLSVGVKTNVRYARVTKIDMSTKDWKQQVKLDKDDYVNLSRLDYLLSIRFYL